MRIALARNQRLFLHFAICITCFAHFHWPQTCSGTDNWYLLTQHGSGLITLSYKKDVDFLCAHTRKLLQLERLRHEKERYIPVHIPAYTDWPHLWIETGCGLDSKVWTTVSRSSFSCVTRGIIFARTHTHGSVWNVQVHFPYKKEFHVSRESCPLVHGAQVRMSDWTHTYTHTPYVSKQESSNMLSDDIRAIHPHTYCSFFALENLPVYQKTYVYPTRKPTCLPEKLPVYRKTFLFSDQKTHLFLTGKPTCFLPENLPVSTRKPT